MSNALLGIGRRATYTCIVLLIDFVHFDFDMMPESKFKKMYRRTKLSVWDRAPYYDSLWRTAQ